MKTNENQWKSNETRHGCARPVFNAKSKIRKKSASVLEREIKSSWGSNLAWFGRPSWGQVAAKLPGSRPKSALVSGLDSEPGSELQFETHQSNRVPRMFLVSFRVSFLNLAQASCMFLIPLVSFVNLALSSRMHRCSMKLVWIVDRFSMILESFEGPKFHDFGVVLGSKICLLYTSPSPRDRQKSRMPSSA